MVKSQDAREHYIDAGGTRIRYLEAGSEHTGPPLVLFHGYRAGGDYWFPHPLPALSAEFHVIAPDLPGFGYSQRLPLHTLADYAAAMNLFFDALGLSELFLLGHSMGGQVAIATAAREPGRVNKLVLVSSSGLPRTTPAWRVPIEMMADSSMRHIRIYPTMIRLGAMTTAGKEGLKMLQHDFVSSYLKSLTMPALIIWGSRDRVVPLEHGALLVRHMPNARLAVVRGAGHMPFYQKPEEFNPLVLSFLRQGVNNAPAIRLGDAILSPSGA